MIVEIQVEETKRSGLSTDIGLIPMILDWDQGTGNLTIKLASPAHDQTALHFCFGIGINGYQLALNRDRCPGRVMSSNYKTTFWTILLWLKLNQGPRLVNGLR